MSKTAARSACEKNPKFSLRSLLRRTADIWRARDGLDFQRRLRDEWKNRTAKS